MYQARHFLAFNLNSTLTRDVDVEVVVGEEVLLPVAAGAAPFGGSSGRLGLFLGGLPVCGVRAVVDALFGSILAVARIFLPLLLLVALLLLRHLLQEFRGHGRGCHRRLLLLRDHPGVALAPREGVGLNAFQLLPLDLLLDGHFCLNYVILPVAVVDEGDGGDGARTALVPPLLGVLRLRLELEQLRVQLARPLVIAVLERVVLVLGQGRLPHGVVEGLVAELLLALDDGVDVGRGVLVVEGLPDLVLLSLDEILGGKLLPRVLRRDLPLVKLGGRKRLVGDEFEPEDPLLLPELQLETGVGARLANVVDLGRLANVNDFAASIYLAAGMVLQDGNSGGLKH